MKVVKQINNNAALALDNHGSEVVIIGNGVGFPHVPYELTDLTKIRRTFYDIDPKFMEMIASIPQNYIIASADIVEKAEMELDCQLNPNLSFTLADHLYFASQRISEDINITSPLAYDVKQLYLKEYLIAVEALSIVRSLTNVNLPENEITNIALHIIGAEKENGNNNNKLVTLQIMKDIDVIIEDKLQIKLKKDSFQYGRFVMHLRYLIQRLSTGEKNEDTNSVLLMSIKNSIPETYECALSISDYFSDKWNWTCSKDEIFYLMLHINRMILK